MADSPREVVVAEGMVAVAAEEWVLVVTVVDEEEAAVVVGGAAWKCVRATGAARRILFCLFPYFS